MAGKSVKDIVVKVIPANIAVPFVKAHHYSHKVVQNSCLHFGAFLGGVLHGVMSYGPSMDKRKTIGLVAGTGWNEFLELNRMAFDDALPRNSESRCIGISLRLIRKNAPHVKWVISFADGCSCGDGTIYRASNFVLTGITENKTILQFPTGEKFAAMTLEANFDSASVAALCKKMGLPIKARTRREWLKLGAEYVNGYQLRYIYFLDPSARSRLTVPIIPFSVIDERGAGMYKGERITREERRNGAQGSELNRRISPDSKHPAVG